MVYLAFIIKQNRRSILLMVVFSFHYVKIFIYKKKTKEVDHRFLVKSMLLCVICCISLLVHLFFYFYLFSCLSSDVRLLIIPLVSKQTDTKYKYNNHSYTVYVLSSLKIIRRRMFYVLHLESLVNTRKISNLLHVPVITFINYTQSQQI